LEKICKRNCHNQYYIKILTNQYKNPSEEKRKLSVTLSKDYTYEIVYIHKPKTDFVELLVSVGGLAAMWFGFSLYDSSVMSFSFLVELMIKLSQRYRKQFHTLRNSFRILVIITFTGLMFYQLEEIIEIYLKEETITRLNILTIKTLPELIISPIIFTGSIFQKIFPKIKYQLKPIIENKDIKLEEKANLIIEVYNDYLISLLNKNEYEELDQYFDLRKFTKSCKVKISTVYPYFQQKSRYFSNALYISKIKFAFSSSLMSFFSIIGFS